MNQHKAHLNVKLQLKVIGASLLNLQQVTGLHSILKGTACTEPFRWPWEPKPATPPLPDIENNTAGPITVSIESNDGKPYMYKATSVLKKAPTGKSMNVR